MLNENVIFYFFSLLLIISAFMVVVSVHPVFSLLFLVSSFLCASFLLFILECEILALLFIIVYVGAIAILFLFSIMMLESKQMNLFKNAIKYLPIGLFFGIALFGPFILEMRNYFSFSDYFTIKNWYNLSDSILDVDVYGQVLYSYFVLQLLVVGLILLLVLIGVTYLMNNFNTTQSKTQVIFKQLARRSFSSYNAS